VTIEDWRTAAPVYLDRQHGAFRGTNPELGSAMFGDPRSTVASAFARRHDDTTIIIRDAGKMPTRRSLRARLAPLAALGAEQHTLGIVDRLTGQVRPAQIFVAVMGASNFTYAEASWTQALSAVDHKPTEFFPTATG
jgi:hypothetical protein